MKYLILSALLCALFTLSATAQSNYRTGYIVKANNDTVKGYINYREWNKSPKSIEFKLTNNGQTTVFDASSLKSFQVTGFERFIGYTGQVTSGKVNQMELSAELDTGKRQDTSFLKVLSAGPNVTLLYHADNIKHRYFIMETGAKPVELKYYAYLNTRNYIVSVSEYRDQIIALIQKYAPEALSMQKDIKQVSYSNELIKYIRVINKNISQDTVKSSSGSRFFVGAGLSYNITDFKAPEKFLFGTSPASIGPVITLGFDFLRNKDVQKSFIRIEALFVSKSAKYTGAAGYYTFQQYSAVLAPQYFINLYNTDNIKFFIAGGGRSCI